MSSPSKGDFPFDPSGIVPDGVIVAEGTYMPMPVLRFLDEDHLAHEAPCFPCPRVDLAAGTVSFTAPARQLGPLDVLDAAERPAPLTADDAAWAAARRIAAIGR